MTTPPATGAAAAGPVGFADAGALHRARSRLLGVSYRITGTWADAEEAADEALARLTALPSGERPHNLDAWLTTVTTRLSIDRLRRRRREDYIGDWLPEPVDTALLPDEHAERNEGLRMALLIAYEQLAPRERAAFVLREAYALPYAEIADVLDQSPATVRQWARRARHRLHADGPTPVTPGPQQVEPLLDAILSGDLDAVKATLADGVRVVSDGGGRVNAARRVITGPRKVAYFLVKSAESAGDDDLAPVEVNGEPALASRIGGVIRVFQLQSTADGRISGLLVHCNPEKLSRVRVPGHWR